MKLMAGVNDFLAHEGRDAFLANGVWQMVNSFSKQRIKLANFIRAV